MRSTFVEIVTDWVKKNRLEAFLLATILIFGAYFRLYRIDEYMTFLGDEGRDAIIVRRLLVDFDLVLVGPGTSIGNMYLGPLYYYLMAPFLFLANFSPVGPAVMIALLGIATIFFVWKIGREWFGKLVGITASLLYAISPTVIVYSKSSWNPNIMPFFALLCIYSIWKIWKFNQLKCLVVLGISYAFVLQSHYLGLLLVPVLALFWLLTVTRFTPKPTNDFKRLIKYSVIGFGLFLMLMSPLVIFDSRHEWRNFSAIKRFFLERQTTVSARPWTAIPELSQVTDKMATRLVAGTNEAVGLPLGMVFLAILFASVVLMIYIIVTRKRFTETLSAYFLLIIWIGVGLTGLALYKQEIYDHYYGFFFPAPFLLIGGVAGQIVHGVKRKGILIRTPIYFFLLLAFGLLLFVNLANNPLKYPPNRQLQRTVEVAQKIVGESESSRFNLAVIAERNYEGAYQYFLEMWNAPIVMIDPQKFEETATKTLFVVCELPKEKCNPVNNPKAEIANFGWSKVDGEWQVAGTILYKLARSQ